MNKYQAEGAQTVIDIFEKVAGAKQSINSRLLPTIIIINTHEHFAIAFLPLTTRLSTELFEAVFIEKSSG